MQVTAILICLVVISTIQAALVTTILKPKLNLMHSQRLQNPEILKYKSPEERRKFSLFPKSSMKYVISLEPIFKIATHKPMVHGTKKPLMKKLHLHDNKIIVVENETEQPSTEPMYEKEIAVTPKVDTVLVGEEISIEVVEDKSEESNEKQNDNSEEEDKLQNESNEFKTATADTENKKSSDLKDPMYSSIAKPIEVSTENKNIEAFSENKESSDLKDPMYSSIAKPIEVSTENKNIEAVSENKKSSDLKNPMYSSIAKPIEVSTENKNIEAFSDVSNGNKKSKEIETPDWTEFIFVDLANKPTEDDKISSEEEYVTTEFYEEPEIVRQKRGSNVIEEENLASTVAGYKFTWKDTRLNNDVAYKNIHS